MIALGDQSPISYNILLPILQKGIDINSPDELNLLEDSMQVCTYLIFIGRKIITSDLVFISSDMNVQLWEATVSHAPSMVPQLLPYFPCLLEIMERSFDHLQVKIVQISRDFHHSYLRY